MLRECVSQPNCNTVFGVTFDVMCVMHGDGDMCFVHVWLFGVVREHV